MGGCFSCKPPWDPFPSPAFRAPVLLHSQARKSQCHQPGVLGPQRRAVPTDSMWVPKPWSTAQGRGGEGAVVSGPENTLLLGFGPRSQTGHPARGFRPPRPSTHQAGEPLSIGPLMPFKDSWSTRLPSCLGTWIPTCTGTCFVNEEGYVSFLISLCLISPLPRPPVSQTHPRRPLCAHHMTPLHPSPRLGVQFLFPSLPAQPPAS